MPVNENSLPICTSCYYQRVEPHRARKGKVHCQSCADKVEDRITSITNTTKQMLLFPHTNERKSK